MAGHRGYHTIRSKSHRERQISYNIHVESKKEIQMNLFSKQIQTHRPQKTNLRPPKGEKDGRGMIRNMGLGGQILPNIQRRIYTHPP